jgi:hypothetical protein
VHLHFTMKFVMLVPFFWGGGCGCALLYFFVTQFSLVVLPGIGAPLVLREGREGFSSGHVCGRREKTRFFL